MKPSTKALRNTLTAAALAFAGVGLMQTNAQSTNTYASFAELDEVMQLQQTQIENQKAFAFILDPVKFGDPILDPVKFGDPILDPVKFGDPILDPVKFGDPILDPVKFGDPILDPVKFGDPILGADGLL